MSVRLRVDSIGKRFGTRVVIKNLSFSLEAPGALGVTGPNGAGKTTLLKLLAGLYYPDAGSITIAAAGSSMVPQACTETVKMVSPELALYGLLTAYENLSFFASVSGMRITESFRDELLERVGLTGRGGDRVNTFSSGMKQRLKYAVALMTEPQVLLLDEPTSNLDDLGKRIVREIMSLYRQERLLIVATNDREDLEHVDQVIDLGP